MKTRTIPSIADPFTVEVNGVKYSYNAGAVVSVPDEVATVIDNIVRLMPQAPAKVGAEGQVWTKTASGEGWADVPEYTLPAATSSELGGVKKGAAVADAAESAPTAEEFKALLDSLRNAGIIATS